SRNIIKKYSISFYWLPFEAKLTVKAFIINELNRKQRYNVGLRSAEEGGANAVPTCRKTPYFASQSC
ncbi:MAG: hypothetical protein WCP55_14225, partial [Lentisphaerota bacterium]